MNLSEIFIRRPVMTIALTVSVILFGLLAYFRLPVSDLPSVDYPVIQVQVNYPGATPETMANNVATPLERQFMQIPGLELVTSNNGQGHSSFVLQIDLSKSLDAAATDVQAAITRAQGQLPVDLPSPPTFTKTNPNDQPIQYIALVSDTVTEGQLYDYANTQVGERLSILPGVSQVGVYGTQSAVRIKADPSAMAIRNITLEDLTGAIKNGTAYTGAGQFDGQENPVATIVAAKFDQVQKFLTLSGHAYDPAVLLMAQDAFDDLGAEDKASFIEAAKLGANASRGFAAQAEVGGVAALRQAGMTVQTSIDRASFASAMAGARPVYEKAFGAEIIERIGKAA